MTSCEQLIKIIQSYPEHSNAIINDIMKKHDYKNTFQLWLDLIAYLDHLDETDVRQTDGYFIEYMCNKYEGYKGAFV